MAGGRYQLSAEDRDATRVVTVSGELHLEEAGSFRRELLQATRGCGDVELRVHDLTYLEGGVAAVLAQQWSDAVCHGREYRFVGGEGGVGSILELHTARVARDCQRPEPGSQGILEQVGATTLYLVGTARDMLDYLGRLGLSVLGVLRSPASMRWSDVLRQMERHGADGVPIVGLIGFLMGLITAFQAAVQLHKFGGDVFVADLVGLSITRELGPLMTAIVVAGRSGAAIAAELGTMKVGEEVDALHTLGLDPLRFLVLPRILAVSLVTPLLTMLANALGILAGMLVAMSVLGLSWKGYLLSTEEALSMADVFGGLLKAGVFGALVATISCERGLATRGGAEGVGRSTTSAVVAILFHLILVDAGFSVLFNLWGI